MLWAIRALRMQSPDERSKTELQYSSLLWGVQL